MIVYVCMKSPTKKLQKIKIMAVNDHRYRKKIMSVHM